jgi:hypothetical protein
LATERNYDFVRIYNGTNNTGTLIGEYSGTTLPANIEFVGTSAFVTFTSDVSNEFEGFVLNYNHYHPLMKS